MSLSLSANDLIRHAFNTIGVLAAGEPLTADMQQDGYFLLRELIDTWNTQQLTVILQDRVVYDLVAGKGSPTNPYLIGPGLVAPNLSTGTAARPVAIRAASILQNTTAPYPVEIPLAILTDDMYAANPIKTIQTQIPQTLYYQPSVPNGAIQLWNVPDNAANDLVLYLDLLTPQFVTATTVTVLAPGYTRAFRFGIAAMLCDYYGVNSARADFARKEAGQALQDIKMQNAPMQDLSTEPGFLGDPHGTYIIQTDTGA